MSVSAPQQYMLAASTPLLKGQALCEFLSKMDEEEHKLLTEETELFDKEVQELDKRNSYGDIFFKSVCVGLGFGGAFGAVAHKGDVIINKPEPFRPEIYTKPEYAEKGRIIYNNNEAQRLEMAEKNGIKVAAASFLVSGFAYGFSRFILYRYEKESLTENLSAKIIFDRILRLKDKIKKIEEKETQNPEREEKEQLDRSKNFFDQTQTDMTLSKTNKITVVHHYV